MEDNLHSKAYSIYLLRAYEDFMLKSFRNYITNSYEINLYGLKKFIKSNDSLFISLVEILRSNDFIVNVKGEDNTLESIKCEYTDLTDNTTYNFDFPLINMHYMIELSSKTELSLPTIFLMRIISKIIAGYKTLHKAIVLDLDETLWSGTLSEDGIDCIIENMRSPKGIPFITFMKYIKVMSEELGVYVAICSRNNSDIVADAINKISEDLFPLKKHIDYIVANDNDKSDNILSIAKNLQIQTNAIVFIDDNIIERDKVKTALPNVIVPYWDSHIELITLIIACCLFDRFELSINAQLRKEQLRIIKEEVKKNTLPKLNIKVLEDIEHKESKKLYAKSNQYKFIAHNIDYNEAKSLFFEIYRLNGTSLGICSALTYIENDSQIHILNWAISCRYFQIGLEEFIILYLSKLAEHRSVIFDFTDTGHNGKAIEFVNKNFMLFTACDDTNIKHLTLNTKSIDIIAERTNLELL